MSYTAKGPVKAALPVLAICKMPDCIYHEGAQGDSADICRCSHPHKAKEAPSPRCSLYQLDFMKKMGLALKK